MSTWPLVLIYSSKKLGIKEYKEIKKKRIFESSRNYFNYFPGENTKHSVYFSAICPTYSPNTSKLKKKSNNKYIDTANENTEMKSVLLF